MAKQAGRQAGTWTECGVTYTGSQCSRNMTYMRLQCDLFKTTDNVVKDGTPVVCVLVFHDHF